MCNNDVYAYAWGPKGKRIYGLKQGSSSQRINCIATLNKRQLKAPFVFEGSCNTDIFCLYLKKILSKSLKPGKTVVMDNASFHKSPMVKKIIKQAKCKLLYLPAYSPDLNPIEKRWFPIKNSIRKKLELNNYDLYACAKMVFT
jgi:transposase